LSPSVKEELIDILTKKTYASSSSQKRLSSTRPVQGNGLPAAAVGKEPAGDFLGKDPTTADRIASPT
jgi:hypothetical protein